ncbi:MAG: hypothetical protein LBV52_05085, partial [Spirochaetaceae bacterium]|nr:hypothetical protein [Spirochaetaceae bacterium]
PYGNIFSDDENELPPDCAQIAPFARFNYYKEAVKRLKAIAFKIRTNMGGKKSDYRIFCNSEINEKDLAILSGLGFYGKNSLIITKKAGSLVVLAALKLPFKTENCICNSKENPPEAKIHPCEKCSMTPCVAACPTGAVLGNGKIELSLCIQWYASGNGDIVPPKVRNAWGKRLYGCTNCQDACPHNKKTIAGIETTEGKIGAFVNVKKLLSLNDTEIKSLFKGTAMGLSWLTPDTIRRSAKLVLDGEQ